MSFTNMFSPRIEMLTSKLLIGEKLGSITNMFLPRKKLLISKLLIGANFKEKKISHIARLTSKKTSLSFFLTLESGYLLDFDIRLVLFLR